jgi:type II secretory pathway component PulM
MVFPWVLFESSSSRSSGSSLWGTGGMALLLSIPAIVIPSLPAASQVASTLLNPLVAAWIKSAVGEVDNLRVQIAGSDQQILQGLIPQAQVSGDNLSYQGFQVSRIALDGQNIQLNVGQALQGQALRLIAPVPVEVKMFLSQADLNQTLQADLVREQLAQAQVNLPIGGTEVPFLISDPNVTLEPGQLRIQANLTTPDGATVPVTLTTGLTVQNQNQLLLVNPTWISEGQALPIAGLNNLAIQLDPDVNVQKLELQQGQLLYEGSLTIRPEELAATAG